MSVLEIKKVNFDIEATINALLSEEDKKAFKERLATSASPKKK